jgi:alkylation response protein AidB-like acyl-CoA dehydrogenase
MLLSREQDERRLSFRRFCQTYITPFAEGFEQTQSLSGELIKRMAEEGFLGLTVPREDGGSGCDMVTYGLLHEEVGQACGSTRSLLTVHEMVCYALQRWGSPAQRKRWLPELAGGRKIGAFAATESGAGSDLAGIETVAIESDNGYLLKGQKKWISFGQIADVFLVLARSRLGLITVLVDRYVPGLIVRPIEGMLGLAASMLAQLVFEDGLLVPKENVIGRPGFGLSHVMSSALLHGRYSVAWGCVAIAEECLALTSNVSNGRRQFGAVLSDHQLVKRMISDMVVGTEAARLMCLQCGHMLDHGQPEAVIQTMMAKYFASKVASAAATDALQVHGAVGCSMHSKVARLWRDARIMEIIEGSTQIQQVTIADCYRTAKECRAALATEIGNGNGGNHRNSDTPQA